MILSERAIASTTLIGGRLCLDFVNTVGGRVFSKTQADDYEVVGDKLSDYYDLLAWVQLTKALPEAQIQELVTEASLHKDKANIILKQAIDLREAIYRICKQIIKKKAPEELDLKMLNRQISMAYSHIELVLKDDVFTWQWNNKALEKALYPIIDSLAEFLTTGDLSRLRECGGVDCCWLFEDTSKNKMRQWCDMQTCGNLAKVRRFRSKTTKK
jgi:predicted RNA-binding Zn ribbon-like protein